MTVRRLVLASLLVAALGAGVGGQTATVQSPRPYAATSTAILVDVVVRDGRGRPITDLTAADFAIAEDGVAQAIGSFSRVTRGGGIGVGVAWRSPRTITVGGATGAAATTTALPPEDATTALVFDRLSAETLRLAQRATLGYMPAGGESSVRVGVFATDMGVRAIQRYTNDRGLVRRAVGQVQPTGLSDEEQRADRSEDLIARRKTLAGEAESAGANTATGASAALVANASVLGERETELRLVQTELNMLRSIDNSERGRRGYDTSVSLLAVVRSLAEYPGRKTIVFFSEGLPVSPSLSARLDAVIDAANRSNVTVYAVDTKGLLAKSAIEKAHKELDAFADERRSQVVGGADRTELPLSMAMERVEDTLSLESRAGLSRLSGDTGGFLIEGSNDLTAAFRRIDEDNQFHYLLTYAPSNDTPDGRFRAIRVRVERKGAQVFARRGYRALRPRSIADGESHGAAALGLLDRAPLANAFPIEAAGFSFPDPARPGLSPLLVHLPTSVLRFDVGPDRASYSGRATVVVRLRDGRGREVQTLSQDYTLTGAAADLEAAKQGSILFYREVDLTPGVYTMESIAYDDVARQGSVRVSTLTVPAAAPGNLGMSSLVLVGRAEEQALRPGDAESRGPLYVGRTLLYPNLGEPIRKTGSGELTFYFALYGEQTGAAASVQLVRSGVVLATAPIELPPPTLPRSQHVGRLPIGRLPAGTYELRIQVSAGGRELSRTAYFTLAN